MLEVLTRCRRLGGGVAIVLSFLLAVLLAAILGAVKPDLATGILGAGIGIALLLPRRSWPYRCPLAFARPFRRCLLAAVPAWRFACIGLFRPCGRSGVVGRIAAAFYLVWMLNLSLSWTVSMGLPALRLCVCVGAALLVVVSGVGSDEASQGVWLAALLAAAVTGFLSGISSCADLHGDAGSGFLGVIIGGLSLQAAWVSPQLFWGWLILLGVFIVDATLTLLRRLLRETRFMRRIAVTHTSMLLVITGVIFLLPWQWEASTSSGCCHWHCLSQRGRSTACLLC